MSKLRFQIVVTVALLIWGGCSTARHDGFQVKSADYYFFGGEIDDEANGKPAMPVDGTWENYWKGRYAYLRSHRPSENAEETIRWIETSRAKRGLKPIEK